MVFHKICIAAGDEIFIKHHQWCSEQILFDSCKSYVLHSIIFKSEIKYDTISECKYIT